MKKLQNSLEHTGFTNASWTTKGTEIYMKILLGLLVIFLCVILAACNSVPYKDSNGNWTSACLFICDKDDAVMRTVDNDDNITIHKGTRTDLVQRRITIEEMSPDLLRAKCAEWPRAIACTTDDARINLRGEPLITTMLINFQFMDWGGVREKCSGKPACHDATTFYLDQYSLGSAYERGVVGDELAHMMNIDVGFNQRTALGDELFHMLGYGHGFVFPWSVNEGLR